MKCLRLYDPHTRIATPNHTKIAMKKGILNIATTSTVNNTKSMPLVRILRSYVRNLILQIVVPVG